jgi:NAD(P)-dependent dehydrogenase (short-subunit alcohol dehydrogenase family)
MTTSSQYIAYGQSKTANVLFSVSLNHRLYKKYGIRSYALHPGTIFTDLWRHTDKEFVEKVKDSRDANGTVFKTLEQGCSTTLVAALDPKLSNVEEGMGIYLDDCQFAEPSPWAKDDEAAEKLWDISERLVGEKMKIR